MSIIEAAGIFWMRRIRPEWPTLNLSSVDFRLPLIDINYLSGVLKFWLIIAHILNYKLYEFDEFMRIIEVIGIFWMRRIRPKCPTLDLWTADFWLPLIDINYPFSFLKFWEIIAHILNKKLHEFDGFMRIIEVIGIFWMRQIRPNWPTPDSSSADFRLPLIDIDYPFSFLKFWEIIAHILN